MTEKNIKFAAKSVKMLSITSDTSNGCIVYTENNGKRLTVLVSGKLLSRIGAIRVGSVYEVVGKIGYQAPYGKQLFATSIECKDVSGEFIFEYLARSPSFQGIGLGKARIQALKDKFGKIPRRLMVALDKSDTKALTDCVGESVAAKLISAWIYCRTMVKSELDLIGLGVKPSTASQLVDALGDAALDKLKASPYSLVAFTDFKTADAFALSVGVHPSSEERLGSIAADAALGLTKTTGSSFLVREELVKAIKSRGVNPSDAINAAENRGTLLNKDNIYQLPAHTRMEKSIRESLGQVLSTFKLKLFDKDIDAAIEKYQVIIGVTLDDDQKLAVRLAINSNFFALTGSAGTGKSLVIGAVSYVIAQLLGIKTYCIALSGIAADRVRESVGDNVYTIAKFQSLLMTGEIKIEKDTLIVVDETSMVGVPTLYSLLNSLPCNLIRLLVVGDNDQLEAIEYGNPFWQFVNHTPSFRLKNNWRLKSGSKPLEFADYVKQGLFMPSFDDDFDIRYVESTELLDEVAEAYLDEMVVGSRIISPAKSLASDINMKVQGLLYPSKSSQVDIEIGEPVIFGKNSYKHRVWNGTQGTYEGLVGSDVVVRIGSESKLIPEHEIRGLGMSLSYALTGHRTQGAGFKGVIIVLSKASQYLVDRKWLYTTITRSKGKCILFVEAGVDLEWLIEGKEPVSRVTQRLFPKEHIIEGVA